MVWSELSSLNMPIIYRQGALIELVMKLTYRCTRQSRENFPNQACALENQLSVSAYQINLCVWPDKKKNTKKNYIGKTVHVLLLYCFPMQFPCGFHSNPPPKNKVKYKKKLIKPLKIQAQTLCVRRD